MISAQAHAWIPLYFVDFEYDSWLITAWLMTYFLHLNLGEQIIWFLDVTHNIKETGTTRLTMFEFKTQDVLIDTLHRITCTPGLLQLQVTLI